ALDRGRPEREAIRATDAAATRRRQRLMRSGGADRSLGARASRPPSGGRSTGLARRTGATAARAAVASRRGRAGAAGAGPPARAGAGGRDARAPRLANAPRGRTHEPFAGATIMGATGDHPRGSAGGAGPDGGARTGAAGPCPVVGHPPRARGGERPPLEVERR